MRSMASNDDQQQRVFLATLTLQGTLKNWCAATGLVAISATDGSFPSELDYPAQTFLTSFMTYKRYRHPVPLRPIWTARKIL
jgi:hypothetical protein